MEDKSIVESLENICLDNIGLNLSLNYEICKNLKIKIPDLIGDKIFKNIFTVLSRFNEKDLKFFTKEIMNIKNIEIFRKQFVSIKYFDFLNGHKLDNLQVGDCDYFELNSNNCSFTVKHLLINTNFLNILENLRKFQECCKITESIIVEIPYPENLYDSKLLFNMFDKSIKIIDLSNVDLRLSDFKELMFTVENMKYLNELTMNLRFLSREKILVKELKYYFNYLPKNLKKLNIQIDMDQRKVSSCMPSILKRLENLISFSFNVMPLKFTSSKQIIKSLDKFSSKNLQCLDLIFLEISDQVNILLAELIRKCSLLKELNIFCAEKSQNMLNKELIESLQLRAGQLNICRIPISNPLGLKEDIERLIPNFSSFVGVDLGDFINYQVDDEYLIKFINSTQNKLKVLKINQCNLNRNFFKKINFGKFHQLIEIQLSNLRFGDGSFCDLFTQLMHGNCGRNLLSFFMKRCIIEKKSERSIGNFLYTCQQLSDIHLEAIQSSSTLFNNIINGLYSCTDKLKSISITECKFTDQPGSLLAKLFWNCRSIEFVSLNQNPLTSNISYEILNNLKNSKRSLDKFEIDCILERNKTFQDIANIAKNYHNLTEFRMAKFIPTQ